ncbi:Flagellin [Ensifer sp. M14]|uniref:flagellin N-terminal helical domain-containing protein n=1 Tax=Ensifer sp. M14 TaxID=2203782 RepID=UPI000E1D88B3|nr:flagellin [Ensifer sp. M14]RDL49731.1 Flagellin [Ensifer sp. M14]
MNSIHSNAGAATALQTLRTLNVGLATAQDQISSGLRVETAKDNAAYWSISTTMRSDDRAIVAVVDALGLGAAQAEVAYSGLEATINVLDEIKAKLVAAKEGGVDRGKIQAELDQLKQQAVGLATSASFSGVNWVNTDIANLAFARSVRVDIPAALTRSGSGALQLETLSLDIANVSLLNRDGGGALQADGRSVGNIAGLTTMSGTTAYGARARESYAFAGPVTLSPTDSISFDITVDAGPHSAGATYAVTINKALVDSRLGTTDGVIPTRAAMVNILNQAMVNAGLSGKANVGTELPDRIAFFSLEGTGSDDASITITNLASSLPGGVAGGLENAPVTDVDNGYAKIGFSGSPSFRMHGEVVIAFELVTPGNPPQTITIDRTVVDSVLGTSDGLVNAGADFAAVLNHALAGTGVSATGAGIAVTLEIDPAMFPTAGSRSQFQILNVRDNIGNPPDFNLVDIDIETAGADIDNYLAGIEGMLVKVTDAAATLGAFSKRIQMQQAFNKELHGTISAGIGGLVDADMEEASTRLKALQAQQQLAVQALQIANADAQAIMQLFE